LSKKQSKKNIETVKLASNSLANTQETSDYLQNYEFLALLGKGAFGKVFKVSKICDCLKTHFLLGERQTNQLNRCSQTNLGGRINDESWDINLRGDRQKLKCNLFEKTLLLYLTCSCYWRASEHLYHLGKHLE